MAADRLLAFSLVCLAVIVVPGPSVLFVISRALTLGRAAAIATVAGNAAGLYVQVVAVSLGLAVVLQRSELAFDVVKLAGAAYLALLGIRTILDRKSLSVAADESAVAPGTPAILRQGFIVGLTNPKTTVFFAAFLPQFTVPGGSLQFQMLVLGLIFVAIALVSDSAWGLASGQARSWFEGSPRRREFVGAIGGTIMIGLAARLAISNRIE
jgi:threonine/homoserine/homoserine lactone efflux protein